MSRNEVFCRRLGEVLERHVGRRVADAVGVSPSALSGWKTGRSSPDPEALALLCRELEVSADYLLGLVDHERAAPSEPAGSEEDLWVFANHVLKAIYEAIESSGMSPRDQTLFRTRFDRAITESALVSAQLQRERGADG